MAQETHSWKLQGGLKPAAECEVLETRIPDFQAESGGPHLSSPGGLPFHTLLSSIFLRPSLLQTLNQDLHVSKSWLMTFTDLQSPCLFPST